MNCTKYTLELQAIIQTTTFEDILFIKQEMKSRFVSLSQSIYLMQQFKKCSTHNQPYTSIFHNFQMLSIYKSFQYNKSISPNSTAIQWILLTGQNPPFKKQGNGQHQKTPKDKQLDNSTVKLFYLSLHNSSTHGLNPHQ